MSDLIRQARAVYGPAYDQMLEEAGRIKLAYLAGGGRPEDVVSPERLEALRNGGPEALASMDPNSREDGSVAGPYVPTEMALTAGLIEPRAVPAVMDAMSKGITTVSSGFDPAKNVGFAIGRNPQGQVVRHEQ